MSERAKRGADPSYVTATYVCWQAEELGPLAKSGSNASSEALLTRCADVVAAHGGRTIAKTDRVVIASFGAASLAAKAVVDAGRRSPRSVACPGTPQLRAAVSLGEVQGAQGGEQGARRCSQLAASLLPGQVGFTLPVQDLVRDLIPDGFRFEDLGIFTVGDPPRCERVFALLDEDAPVDAPTESSADQPRCGFPSYPAGFFGRIQELAAVQAALEDARLVTIIGIAGVGKTRLAVEAACAMLEESPESHVFVDLTPLENVQQAVAAIGAPLGFPGTTHGYEVERLATAIGQRPILLLLDNCEHLIPELSALVQGILTGCSQARILATSREPFRLRAERQLLLDGMRAPGVSGHESPSDLLRFDAVRLFMDRAEAVRAGFRLSRENAPAVGEICRRLEGIPLAIEIAASKLNVLGPAELLSRIEAQVGLLDATSLDHDPRHHSLSAAIQSSYDALDEPTSALFRRLSVFRGGFSVDDVETSFADDEALAGREAVALLGVLLGKSLVAAQDHPDGSRRFRLYAAVQEFATAKLEQAGESLVATARHSDRFYLLARELTSSSPSDRFPDWLQMLDVSYPNVRAALRWCIQHSPTGAKPFDFCSAVQTYLTEKAAYRESRLLYEDLIDRFGEVDPVLLACAHANAASLAGAEGETAVARAHLDLAMEISERTGFRKGVAAAWGAKGTCLEREGKLEEAQAAFEASAALWTELGQIHDYWTQRGNAISVLCRMENYEEALCCGYDYLTYCESTHEPNLIAEARVRLAEVCLGLGRLEQAEALLDDALHSVKHTGSRFALSCIFFNMAKLSQLQGSLRRATVLLAAAHAVLAGASPVAGGIDTGSFEKCVGELRAAAGERFATLWRHGASMDLEQAISYALPPQLDIPAEIWRPS